MACSLTVAPIHSSCRSETANRFPKRCTVQADASLLSTSFSQRLAVPACVTVHRATAGVNAASDACLKLRCYELPRNSKSPNLCSGTRRRATEFSVTAARATYVRTCIVAKMTEMKHAKRHWFNALAANIAAIYSISTQGGKRRFEKKTGNHLTASLNAGLCLAFW